MDHGSWNSCIMQSKLEAYLHYLGSKHRLGDIDRHYISLVELDHIK